jgi:hypothetical protein
LLLNRNVVANCPAPSVGFVTRTCCGSLDALLLRCAPDFWSQPIYTACELPALDTLLAQLQNGSIAPESALQQSRDHVVSLGTRVGAVDATTVWAISAETSANASLHAMQLALLAPLQAYAAQQPWPVEASPDVRRVLSAMALARIAPEQSASSLETASSLVMATLRAPVAAAGQQQILAWPSASQALVLAAAGLAPLDIEAVVSATQLRAQGDATVALGILALDKASPGYSLPEGALAISPTLLLSSTTSASLLFIASLKVDLSSNSLLQATATQLTAAGSLQATVPDGANLQLQLRLGSQGLAPTLLLMNGATTLATASVQVACFSGSRNSSTPLESLPSCQLSALSTSTVTCRCTAMPEVLTVAATVVLASSSNDVDSTTRLAFTGLSAALGMPLDYSSASSKPRASQWANWWLAVCSA